MDVKDYCSSLRSELGGLKTNLDKITARMEKASPEDRQRYSSSVKDLKGVIGDLESSIASLEKECPTEWGPQKEELDRRTESVKLQYEQMMAELSPDDFE